MKKLFTFALAIFAITLFAGCDDKGKDGPDKDSDIVGKWQLVREVGTESLNGEVTNRWDDDTTADKSFTTFSSNGTGFATEAGSDSKSFTYKVSGSVLNITMEGQTLTAEIRKLTTKEMVLFETQTDEEGYKSETTAYFSRK